MIQLPNVKRGRRRREAREVRCVFINNAPLAKSLQHEEGVVAEEVAAGEDAEEVRVGGVAEPLLGDEGAADEGGRVVHVDQDLVQEVVVAQHRRHGAASVALHSSPLRSKNHGADRICGEIFRWFK